MARLKLRGPTPAAFILIIIIIIGDCFEGATVERDEDIRIVSRYKNMSEATNSLYQALIDQSVPFESRCKRYVVLLSMAANKGIPYETTVSQLSSLQEHTVDAHSRNVDARRKSMLLMAAIDRYRVSKLEPPFIELLQCLKQIDLPQVQVYLSDRELILLENLYYHILSSPDSKIDMSQVNVDDLHPDFFRTLRIIFSGHLKEETISTVSDSQVELGQKATSRGAQSSGGEVQKQANQKTDMTAEERRKLQLERKRERERQRRRSLQGDDWHRHREGERLRQRRFRLMGGIVGQLRPRLRARERRHKDQQVGQYLQRQQLNFERYYPEQLAPHFLSEGFASSSEPIGISSTAQPDTWQQQSEQPSTIDDFLTPDSRRSLLPSNDFQQNKQSALLNSLIPSSQSHQRRFRLEQPLDQPMKLYPHFPRDMNDRATSPSSSPPQAYLSPDQVGHRQPIGDANRLDSLSPLRTHFQVQSGRPETLNYVAESESRGGRSPSTGSNMPDLQATDPTTEQSNRKDIQTSVASELNGTDVVTQSSSNPAPPPISKDTFFLADAFDDLGDPWDDFDREWRRVGN